MRYSIFDIQLDYQSQRSIELSRALEGGMMERGSFKNLVACVLLDLQGSTLT